MKRKRRYVFDEETELYYLRSRYYAYEWSRFINADSYSSTVQDILGSNMYAYCCNNSLTRRDATGYLWETIWDIVSLATSVAEVIAKPADPWAWAGLIGDVIDVVLPCVGGVGEAVDAAKTAARVVDKGEDIIDAAKDMYRMADAADDIKHSTGAYIVLYEQGQHYIGKGGFKRAITSATEHMSDSNKVSAIIWAPTKGKNFKPRDEAFVTEYLLQSIYGVGKDVENTYNMIWSPGKKIFRNLQ